MIYILEKDIESKHVIIDLFDYTKYIKYYDDNKIYKQLFSVSNIILSPKQLNKMNNKYIYIISYWFRENSDIYNIWPSHLTHFILRNYFSDFKQTKVTITRLSPDGEENCSSHICTVINLQPKHKYYICMKTSDKNGFISSKYSDLQTFDTNSFILTQEIIDLYCKSYESFKEMTQKSVENRQKLWDIIVKKIKCDTELVITEMICSWLMLFCKKLHKNRTGINIPTESYPKVAKQMVIKVKELLPSDQCKIMTKLYFEQHIAGLLQKISIKQILLDAL